MSESTALAAAVSRIGGAEVGKGGAFSSIAVEATAGASRGTAIGTSGTATSATASGTSTWLLWPSLIPRGFAAAFDSTVSVLGEAGEGDFSPEENLHGDQMTARTCAFVTQTNALRFTWGWLGLRAWGIYCM